MLSFLSQFAVDYTTRVTTTSTETSSGVSPVIIILYLLVIAIVIAGMWKVYKKAGEAGWAAIIPIYSTIVLLRIVGRPLWWILLMLIPFVNLIIFIVVYDDLAKSFGKGVGTTLLLLFLPFIAWPMLGFGSATYHKPAPRQ